MLDPDLLAIQRKRRQEHRCLRCGMPVLRSALCGVCRENWCYCPKCEQLFGRRPALNPRHATEYCRECNTLNKRGQMQARPYAEYLRDIQQRRHELLPKLIRYYRRGENMTNAAHALGLTRSQIDVFIRDARKRGEWPEELRRKQT